MGGNPCYRIRPHDPKDNAEVLREKGTHQDVASAPLATAKHGQRERHLSGKNMTCPWKGPGQGILAPQTSPFAARRLPSRTTVGPGASSSISARDIDGEKITKQPGKKKHKKHIPEKKKQTKNKKKNTFH